MHVSSSSIAQAFAGYSARSSGATSTWRIHSGDSATDQAGPSSGCGGDSSQISSAGFAALLQDGGDQQPTFTDDQANQVGELIQQQDASSFGKLDTDQDGKLSAAELTAALNALQPQQADGGGPPSLTDDQAAKIGERIQQKDPDTFAKLDTDQDGKLSAGEMDAGRKSGVLKPHHHGHGGSEPPAMSDDQAKDFGAMLQQQDPDQFTALDTDQDGTLTASEVEAGRKSGALKPPPLPDAGGMGPGGQGGQGGAGGASSGTSDYMANLLQDLLRTLGGSTAA